MLSSIVDVRTKACVDFALTKHFDERQAAKTLLRSVRPGDMLVFDRGYYSKEFLAKVHAAGATRVWRLRLNVFRGTRSFFNSPRTESLVTVGGVQVQRVKYFITGKIYVCLTNDVKTTRADVISNYRSRWRVEESFKRLKSHLKLEHAHALSPQLYAQEVEARVLGDTVILALQDTQAVKGCARKTPVMYLLTLDVTLVSALDQIRSVVNRRFKKRPFLDLE